MPISAKREPTLTRRDLWDRFMSLCRPCSGGERQLPSDDEWHAVVPRVVGAGFGALVYHNLRAEELLAEVPGPVCELLRAENAAAIARYHIMAEMVGPDLLRLTESVEAVVLKGTALAHTVYPAPHLRQSSDLDLLVRPADAAAAARLLEEMGYIGNYAYTSDHGPAFARTLPSGASISMDLHPDLSRPSEYPFIRPPEREMAMAPASIWGVPCRVLTPEWNYAQTLCQLTWDVWQGGYARYIVDLAHLAAARAYDPAAVGDLVHDSGLRGVEHFARALLGSQPDRTPHTGAAVGTRALTGSLALAWSRPRSRARASAGVMASLLLWDHQEDRLRFLRRWLASLPRRAVGLALPSNGQEG